MLAIAAFKYCKSHRVPWRFIVVAAVVIALTAITYSAPGNRGRLQANNGMQGGLIQVLRNPVRQNYLLVKSRTIWILLSFLVGATCATLGQLEPSAAKRPALNRPYWVMLGIAIAYCISALILLAPASHFFGPTIPPRTIAPVVILLPVCAFCCGAILVRELQWWRWTEPMVLSLTLVACTIAVTRITSDLRVQAPITFRYARSFDRMHHQLCDLGKQGIDRPVVTLELAPSGWLQGANPTTDPNHWINESMQQAYQLKGKLWRLSAGEHPPADAIVIDPNAEASSHKPTPSSAPSVRS
jgi:uncharacterized membrane protein YoaK (UPF0700 family)